MVSEATSEVRPEAGFRQEDDVLEFHVPRTHKQAGIMPKGRPPGPVHIKAVVSGSWAEVHRVQVDDEILRVNGMLVSEMSHTIFHGLMMRRPLALSIKRPQVDLAVMPFDVWLRSLSAAGLLDGYKKALEETYDNPRQVMECYIGSDGQVDAQFYKDVGIELAAHRRAFAEAMTRRLKAEQVPLEAAAEIASLESRGFRDWLLALDSGEGALLCYLETLQENYDDVEQLVDLYVFEGPAGIAFDRQMLADLDVADGRHAALFEAWFYSECCATTVVNAEHSIAAARLESSPLVCTAHSAVTMATAHVEQDGAAEINVPGASRSDEVSIETMDFCAWLVEVDPSGALDRYHQALSEIFDCPRQVLQLYLKPESSGRSFDPQLFEDIGVYDVAHRRLFEAWFASCHARSAEASATRSKVNATDRAASMAVAGAAECKGSSEFAAWLREVDGGSGELAGYLASLNDGFDNVQQLVALYQPNVAPQPTLDPRFFEDVSIRNPQHRTYFAAWFEARAGSSGGNVIAASVEGNIDSTSGSACSVNGGSCGSDFDAWLNSIDPSGALGVYLQTLQDGYDSPQQFEALYASEVGLDPLLFEDVGIEDYAHRELFEAWFIKLASDAKVASWALSSRRGQTSSTPAPARFAKTAFTSWLREVDPSGSLDVYAGEFEEQFDNEIQVLKIYGQGEDFRATDFFGDLNVKDDGQRALFTAWFTAGACLSEPAETTAMTSGDLEEPEAEGPPSTPECFLSNFCVWLRQVAPDGVLQHLAPQLLENFDCPAQVFYLYAQPGGGLDPCFFKDARVHASSGQRALFVAWFAKRHDLVPPNHSTL